METHCRTAKGEGVLGHGTDQPVGFGLRAAALGIQGRKQREARVRRLRRSVLAGRAAAPALRGVKPRFIPHGGVVAHRHAGGGRLGRGRGAGRARVAVRAVETGFPREAVAVIAVLLFVFFVGLQLREDVLVCAAVANVRACALAAEEGRLCNGGTAAEGKKEMENKKLS